MLLTSDDLLTHRRSQQQQPRNGGRGHGSSCDPANFYGRPKNEEGILVSPLSSGGGGGGGGGKRKLKLEEQPSPFMGELFSYLNVAETATAAAMGGDELPPHSGNIIEERRTEASSLAQVCI